MEVELTRDLLVDLGGWAVLKEARSLVEAERVVTVEWSDKMITGEVLGSGSSFFPRLNLRSITFAENRCNCPHGRRGNVCAHAIALCLASMQGFENKSVVSDAESSGSAGCDDADEVPAQAAFGKVKTIVLSQAKGLPARMKVLLPPNLFRAAEKDRIAIRVELEMASGACQLLQNLDRGRAYHLSDCDQLLGGYIEHLCGGKLHSMLQLNRAQLLQMFSIIADEGMVAWLKSAKTPIPWKGGKLEAVHERLESEPLGTRGDEPGAAVEPIHQPAVAVKKRAVRTESDPVVGTSRRVTVDGSPLYLAIELPARSDPSFFEIHDLLQRSRFRLEPSNGKWWLRDGHHVMNFLADHWLTFQEQYQAEFSKNFKQRMAGVALADVTVNVTPVGNAYELQVGVSGDASVAQMREQLAKGRRFLKTGKKTWLINQKQIQKMEELSSKMIGSKKKSGSGIGMTLKGSTQDLCDWEALLNEYSIDWVAPEQWQQRSNAIRHLSKLSEAPVDGPLNDRLRLYQKIGAAWMYHLYQHQLSGILADEMGLGKTVQAISLMTAVQRQQQGPVLVVCPAGLVGNWMRELQQFAPFLRARSHHGVSRDKASESWQENYDVVVSSYSTLSRDLELMQLVDWSLIIGDEAQHIKNRRTQHAKSLKQLRAKGKFLLTGTPIENSIEDLFSLFEFLMPGYLKKAPSDATRPEDRKWYQDRIRERSSHYILRRTKKQVAPELPEKIEQVIYCDMEDAQRELYQAIRSSSFQTIEKLEYEGKSQGAIKMAAFTELLRLRQVCADPRVLKPELKASISCKLGVFRELLEESIDGGHRMLVFSQFVSVLQLLKDELDAQGISYCYIDGSTKDRLREADRFNHNEDIPVFLISLKAGGTGLNLTGADTVVHFDPWWNPAVEAQATDRAHRIGQTRKVTSIRLIVSGTVEEKVQVMQAKKRKLLDSLFDESANTIGTLELADVKDLLSD